MGCAVGAATKRAPLRWILTVCIGHSSGVGRAALFLRMGVQGRLQKAPNQCMHSAATRFACPFGLAAFAPTPSRLGVFAFTWDAYGQKGAPGKRWRAPQA